MTAMPDAGRRKETPSMNSKSKAPKKATRPTLAEAKDSRPLEAHEVALSPNLQNAVGVYAWGTCAGKPDLQATAEGLSAQTRKVQSGDLAALEAMLYGQAITLQAIFTKLARRAAANDSVKPFQVNLTLALKAQAQCRATLEALAEIKNPRPVAFVRQMNMSAGPQQVNVTASPDALPGAGAGGRACRASRAGENLVLQNELSGGQVWPVGHPSGEHAKQS